MSKSKLTNSLEMAMNYELFKILNTTASSVTKSSLKAS